MFLLNTILIDLGYVDPDLQKLDQGKNFYF